MQHGTFSLSPRMSVVKLDEHWDEDACMLARDRELTAEA